MNKNLYNSHLSYLSSFYSGKVILVSGSTGLIGSHVIQLIDMLNSIKNSNVRGIGLYRDDEKCNKLKQSLSFPDNIDFVKCDIDNDIPCTRDVDYLIHSAGFSGGTKMHLKDPIKIFDTGINGTRTMLDFAISHKATGFLYISTYEIYGDNSHSERIVETQPCQLDTFVLRNCYAEIKRLCESLLSAFSAKYGLQTYSVRLTSTFGSGVKYNDPRFFAEFARCVIENRDIVLKSNGLTVRSYLDADDAAIAFLYVLANGKNCNAYNLTNMENEISIKDIAKRLIALSGAESKLVFDISQDVTKLGMRKEGKTVMDAGKLEGIGWKPVYSFDDTLNKLLDSMKSDVGSNK